MEETYSREALRSWRRSRGPRLPRAVYEAAGLPVHVIACTAMRRPSLAATVAAEIAFESFSSQPGSLAVCVMPDHVHWVLESAEDLSVRVGRTKAFVASRVRREHCQDGNLWQRSFWDQLLRTEGALRQTMVYVLANPVRRGLVDDPAFWPYSWAREDVRPW